MPKHAKVHDRRLADLLAQLGFGSSDAARRHLARAETLAEELLQTPPDQQPTRYPLEYIVFRLTGYRVDGPDAEGFVDAADLRADIAPMTERLSTAARLSLDQHPTDPPDPRWLTIDALASRWNVARKTVERYRRLGLFGRRVRDEHNNARLIFNTRTVERFEQHVIPTLKAPASGKPSKRLDARTQGTLVRRARRYHRTLGWSFNKAARRLAQRTGIAHSTVRAALDRAAHQHPDQPRKRAPPTPRQRALALRAHNLGIDPQRTARALDRSPRDAKRLAIIEHLSGITRAIDFDDTHAPVRAAGATPGARTRLEQDAVSDQLPRISANPHWSFDDLFALVGRDHEPPSRERDRELSLALGVLQARALDTLDAISPDAPRAFSPPSDPTRASLDALARDLRWAARITAAIVRAHFPIAARAVTIELGVALQDLSPADKTLVARLIIAGVRDGVAHHDPTATGRLAAPIALAVHRRLNDFAKLRPLAPHNPNRARARTSTATPCWAAQVCPWQSLTEPSPAIADRLVARARSDPHADLAVRFFALAGSRPVSATELAIEQNKQPWWIDRAVRRAVGSAVFAHHAPPGSLDR